LIRNLVGVSFLARNEIDTALKYLQPAYDYLEDIVDEEKIRNAIDFVSVCNNIGSAYELKRDWESAVLWLEKTTAYLDYCNGYAVSYKKTTSDVRKHLARLQNILAVSYIKKSENLDSAVSYLLKSLQYFEDLSDESNKEMVATICNNLGSAYKAKKEWQKSKAWLEKSVDIVQNIEDKSVLCYTYGHLSEVYFNLEDEKQSLKYGLQGLELCEKYGNKERGRAIIDIISRIQPGYMDRETQAIIESKKRLFRE